VVFTIPSELNPLVSMNRKVLYDLLFRSVSETLTELANDPKHLGAAIGSIGILHTWEQNLMDHPHIHCIVTGGGLSPDRGRWVSCRKGFFIPVRVMSALFKGKFLDLLKKCFQSDALVFPDRIRHLKQPGDFERFRSQLYHQKWVASIASPLSMASRGSFSTSTDIPIGSRSAITVSSKSVTVTFPSYDGIMQTRTVKRS